MESARRPSGEPEDADSPTPLPDAVIQALERILASQPFHNAESQRAFLRYVVSETLAGRGEQLKEYTIGIEVFRRKESYDPRSDNTVRMKAQKLRWSLSKYYETEGANDAVCISFRPRSYQPVFSFRPAPEPDPQAEAIPATAGSPGKTIRRRLLIRAAAAVLFAGCLAGAYLAGARSLSARDPHGINSIAVLPLRTLGGGSELLSTGLTADLTDSLARIPGIGVIAPSSASVYKGASVDVREVGSRLNVHAVLQGSVQQAGNRVRIDMLVSDTGNGLPLWSATYDREVRDILQTQADISDEVTNAVRLSLAGAMGVPAAAPAVGAGEAHARLGEAYAIDYQWSKAEPEFRKALELSPGRIEVRRTYAGFLEKTGRLSEAEMQIHQDPYAPSAVTLSNLGKNHYFGRRYKEAIAEYRQAIRIYQPLIPHIHADLGIAYVFDGMGRKGIEELEFVRHSSKTMTAFSGQLGYAYAIEGRATDANRILSELLARKDQGDSLSTAIAQIYVGLGDRDRAFEWLDKAVVQRDADLFLKVDPIYDPLRADPRFAGLIRSIHLD